MFFTQDTVFLGTLPTPPYSMKTSEKTDSESIIIDDLNKNTTWPHHVGKSGKD